MSFRRLGLLLALPTAVGLSLAACGTEDDAAPGLSEGGSKPTAGSGGTNETGGTGGSGATGGSMNTEGGMGGTDEPGPGGAGGDSAGGAGNAAGAGGDGPSAAGAGNSPGAGGEGGAPGPSACHTVIANFDTDPGNIGRFVDPNTGPVTSSSVEWTSAEGDPVAGAGKLNATFGAFSEKAQLSLYLPVGTHWTCTTKLHARVKLVAASNIAHINGINFTINTGDNTATRRYALQFTSTTGWTMGMWYSIELPFATAQQNPANTPPDFNDVNTIGVMALAKSDGLTPVTTTLYVDDIWVE